MACGTGAGVTFRRADITTARLAGRNLPVSLLAVRAHATRLPSGATVRKLLFWRYLLVFKQS